MAHIADYGPCGFCQFAPSSKPFQCLIERIVIPAWYAEIIANNITMRFVHYHNPTTCFLLLPSLKDLQILRFEFIQLQLIF